MNFALGLSLLLSAPQVADLITEEQVVTAVFHKLLPHKKWCEEVDAEINRQMHFFKEFPAGRDKNVRDYLTGYYYHNYLGSRILALRDFGASDRWQETTWQHFLFIVSDGKTGENSRVIHNNIQFIMNQTGLSLPKLVRDLAIYGKF